MSTKTTAAIRYSQQSERLSGHPHSSLDERSTGSTTAVEAKFITPHDAVIETADGNRLPSIPLEEAQKLNELKNAVEGNGAAEIPKIWNERDQFGGSAGEAADEGQSVQSADADAPLRESVPQPRTHPLFPPMPLYGPSTWFRDVQCMAFRVSSAILSFNFLLVIVLGAIFTSIAPLCRYIMIVLQGKDPNERRPFYEEEKRRNAIRREDNRKWEEGRYRRRAHGNTGDDHDDGRDGQFVPTEGGKDPLVCDLGYYARRVGLDVEEFDVQTEDGFIIQLWHVYDPKEYSPKPAEAREHRGPELFQNGEDPSHAYTNGDAHRDTSRGRKRKYPVLMVHGLLQSAGAYCTNDDDSLAFYLCKR